MPGSPGTDASASQSAGDGPHGAGPHGAGPYAAGPYAAGRSDLLGPRVGAGADGTPGTAAAGSQVGDRGAGRRGHAGLAHDTAPTLAGAAATEVAVHGHGELAVAAPALLAAQPSGAGQPLAPARTDFTARVEQVQQARAALAGATHLQRTPELATLELALHPGDLGAVKVTVALQARALDVTVACADPATRAAVTAALPALHRELAASVAAQPGHHSGDARQGTSGEGHGRNQPHRQSDDQPDRAPRSARRFDDWMQQ